MIMKKICKKCGEEKELSEFNKRKSSRDGHNTICKLCRNKKERERFRENMKNLDFKKKLSKKSLSYYYANREENCKKKKIWYKENKDEILEKHKKRRSTKKYRLKCRKYYKDNIEIIREKNRKSYHENVYRYVWRANLKRTLSYFDTNKSEKTINLLGYSAKDLKIHIEKQFTLCMEWDNYGEWHIDHIKPISDFDKNTLPSVVNALSNLQPLWSTTRIIDGVLYEGNLNKGTKNN